MSIITFYCVHSFRRERIYLSNAILVPGGVTLASIPPVFGNLMLSLRFLQPGAIQVKTLRGF
ncbi:MAG: hypothetical protein IH594_17835 [Bacteroidales bacterium]|nr:hypothetical protein [Bacteroidales bacterium]